MLSAKIGYFRATANPEALAWRAAVIANGGTVSASTLAAVSNFCNAIQTAGIRDRFYRLNLFAGTGLSAALVPLYRGQSLGGTQFGNTTDTNVNFAAGDYAESTGLTGNGSSKYLQTGLQPSAWITGGNVRSHLAIYKRTSAVVGSSGVMISSRLSSPVRAWEFGAGGHPLGENHGPQPLPTPYDSFLCATRETDASVIGSRNSTFNSAVTYSTTVNATSIPLAIFCRNNRSTDSNGYTPSLYSNQTLAAYSIGGGLTQGEVLAYNTAMQAFQTALGRNV